MHLSHDRQTCVCSVFSVVCVPKKGQIRRLLEFVCNVANTFAFELQKPLRLKGAIKCVCDSLMN